VRTLGALDPGRTLQALSTSLEQDEISASRERCKSLRAFNSEAWHVIEPSVEFKANWHSDAICEHLEAVSNGEIRKLLINVPYRTSKSTICGVAWPAWDWTEHPAEKFLTGSYALKLAIRDSLKMRRLITSPWYRERWGDSFTLTSDQNQKIRFENDKTGYRIAFGVDAGVMGDGGSRILCDDMMDRKAAHSDADREHCLTTFDEAITTRRNDPATTPIVVVMQRLHQRDLSGHLLEKGGWEHLLIPMHYDPKRSRVTCIGWEDPRTEPGELMHPARFDEKTVDSMADEIGPYAAAGQLEQLPVPEGGALFQTGWFEVLQAEPTGIRWVRGWDLAGSKKKTSPYTAGVKMGVKNGTYYIDCRDIVRERWSPAEVEQGMVNTAAQDGHGVAIDFPQDPGQAGLAQRLALIKALAGYVVHSTTETGSKADRAAPVAAQARVGNVKLIAGPKMRVFLEEIGMFPYSTFLDQGDAMSRAFARLLIPVAGGDIVGPKVHRTEAA
jgi:predicted phage terminase large subunit-like protein